MTRLQLSCAALFVCGAVLVVGQPPEKAVIGYIYSPNRPLVPSDVAAEKLTHINYAFANIKDGLMVEGYAGDPENYKTLNKLKERNPKLKILVSVGGWTWSGGFSDMALTPQSRKRFIDSAVAFLERHRLDGLDVDWEYPGQKGLNNTNRPEDKVNCTAFLEEARAALDKAGKAAGKRYLLTMATGTNKSWIEHTEMDKAQASLDFVNLMTYDMAGDWDPVTAHHSPLFTNPASPKGQSSARSVDLFIAAGVPAGKIVLGTPFYGKAWGDVSPVDNGLHQPGKRVTVRLSANFRDIKANLEGKDGFVRYWDDTSKVPFLYNAEKRIFISYEDEQSIGLKGGYVKERGLAGIMFWEYNGDYEGRLLDAINRGLRPYADDTTLALRAGLPLEQTASRGVITRDPSTIVKCKDQFWVFYTGRGIPSFHSKDLVKWEPGPAVFQTAPEWITVAVPENRNMSYWAPDVIHLGDRYLLYYSVSSFGKITSAIALASTPTLDPADPAYHWTDHGIVVQSREGGDFNTIDPSVFSDDNGTLWLAFGSYWSGIKLVQLDPKTGKQLTPEAPLSSLAYNKTIEASYLYKHDGYYYLFVNWGSCCRGVNSTYNIRVGRSRKVTGPYTDKDGVDMLKAGGTLLLSNRDPLFGPGHAGIVVANGKSWFTSDFEGDSRMGGKATLAIMPLTWKSGWPEVEVVDK